MKLTEKLGHSLKKIEILVIITYSYKTENVVVDVARKSGSGGKKLDGNNFSR